VVLDAVVLAFLAAMCVSILFGQGLLAIVGLIISPGILSLGGRGNSGVYGVASFCVALVSALLAAISPSGLSPVFILLVVLGWIGSVVHAVRSVRTMRAADRKRERAHRAVRMLYAASINAHAVRTLRGKNRAFYSAQA
jgi:hypothetical protein